MSPRTIVRSVALMLAAAGTAPLHAQAPDTLPAYHLEGVIVTTPRGAFDRTLVTQRVDVVTGSDISRSGATDVADALRSTTPVDVITYPGLLSGVSIRGFRPQISGVNPRTLILIDGRPAGTSNLSLIHAGGIDRIEIQRGPGSSLYGASAMGGVVNVITRRSGEALRGQVESRFGSFGVYGAEIDVGGPIHQRLNFDVTLTAAGQSSGYRTGARRTFGGDELLKVGADGTISMLARVPSDTLVGFSEYAARSGRARLGYDLGSSWRVDLTAEAFESDGVQNPGDLNPQEWDSRSIKNVHRHSIDLMVAGEMDRHQPLLRIFSTLESNDHFNTAETPNFVNFRSPTRTLGGQLQNGTRVGAHSLTVGADFTRIAAESEAFSADGVPAAPYNPDSAIHSLAAFAEGRLRLFDSRMILTTGARVDRIVFEVRETPNLSGHAANSEHHLAFSPNVGTRFALRPWLQLYGNVGRAFVTPETFSVAGYAEQRAGADRRSVFVSRGNPELRPETSWTWDGGFAFLPGSALEADVGYFQTDVTDRITSHLLPISTPTLTASGDTILSITSYRNTDNARIHGIEGRVSYDIGRVLDGRHLLRLFTTGTKILKAEESLLESGRSQRILNVADLTVIAGVDFDDYRRMSGRFSARYVGERVDTDYVAWWEPGRITYPAHLVLDLTTTLRLLERYTLGLEVRNLGNEDYFEIRGYNLPGRSFRASVGFGF